MITISAPDVTNDEFVCVDPGVREQYIYRYVAETLSEKQRQEFEDHVVFCHKCQADLQYLRWAVQELTTHVRQIKEVLPTDRDLPLLVTAILDGNAQNLIQDYYNLPLMEQLAASTETTTELTFPMTVEYADGRVIGQFLKRAGQLFFRLKKSPGDREPCKCILVYTSPQETRAFELHEGEDKRVGIFREIVSANTLQGMLDTIKRFQIRIKTKS